MSVLDEYIGQSIQEWTNQNSWKTAFIKFKVIWSAYGGMIQCKHVDEISLNFPDLLITRKYLKIRFKNRGSPCYFLSSRGQKIKNIAKIEQERLFLFTFLVSFFWRFSHKN